MFNEDEANDYIAKRLDDIDELEKKINNIKENKQKHVEQLFLKSINNIDKLEKNINRVGTLLGEFDVSKLNEELSRIYKKSFYYICTRRHYTEIVSPSRSYNKIVFNTRGIYEYYPYSQDYVHELYSMSAIMKVIRENYDLLKEYPKDDRRFVFDSFYDVAKNWQKVPTGKFYYEIVDFEIPDVVGQYMSIKNAQTDEIKIENTSEGNFKIRGSQTNSYWNTFKITLGGSNDNLIERHKYILSLLSDEAFDEMEKKAKQINRIYKKNNDLLRNYVSKTASYMLTREM